MLHRKSFILTAASAAVFIEALDIAIINLAIPLIQKSFDLSNDKAQWLQAIYVLVYGGLLLLGGKLADAFGRRKLFLFGAALFLVTSLGAGLSPDFESLLIFRALQGLAAALLLPSALSIITFTYTNPSERSNAIGIFSSFAAIGSGSGLSLGGVIASAFGWQWVFLMNVPLIAIVWWMGYHYFPIEKRETKSAVPDLLSAALLTTGILCLSNTVHELAHVGQRYIYIAGTLIVAGICGWLFVQRSRSLDDPLIRLSLFRSRATLQGNSVSALLGAVFTGYLFIISVVLQNNMHFSAAKAGLLLFPFSVLSALVSKFLLPSLMRKWNAVPTAVFGMALLVAGALALYGCLHFSYHVGFLLLSALFITGSGISIAFPSLMVMSIKDIPTGHHGVATSMVATCYFLGGGLGLSLLSLFMQASTDYVTEVPVVVLGLYALAGGVGLTSPLAPLHKWRGERSVQ